MSYLKNKKAQWILFLIILICVPIIYQQVSGIITGKIQAENMKRPATVQVTTPEERDIYSESSVAGRISAKYSVDVLARINGWLQKRFFDEGAFVKKGQTLFLIEPDQYQNAVNNAVANVKQTQAALVNAQKELTRAKELVKQDYVSKSYYDQALATRDQAQAAYDAAKAQLADARLNLSYTKVTSPIDGKIGKIIITEGNLVNTQSGALARIVSVSPIYVTFNIKSGEFIKYRKLDNSVDFSNMSVKLQLADGTIYDEEGRIEFVDNEVNQTTGTIALRATFDNADELLVPGDFVTVQITAKNPRHVLLVPQASVLDDATGYYVWMVDENGLAERRDIKVSDEIDKKWIVEEGLSAGESYVAKGVQSIRYPKQPLKTEPLEEQQNQENTEKVAE